jgi:uncharacterized protein (TIGR01777 family)
MRVLVTGATGFVGEPLCHMLRAAGHRLVVVSRHPAHAGDDAIGWDQVPRAMRDVDAVVNLAGEPIAARRWTGAQKMRILESRVGTTRALVDAVNVSPSRPAVLVNASAVGFYGDRGEEVIDESAGPGKGFLSKVCQAWEGEAMRAEPLGLRVVRLRFGIILASDGGALARMLPPFRFFVGGPLGDGRQWMSWIHRDDVTGIILETLTNDGYRGPVNVTAPQPVTNRDFVKALGATVARPAILPAPAPVLRLALGEMADMLLTGQRVVPSVVQRLGYHFRYPQLTAALRASARL